MSSARLIRPFARAFQRPAVFASSKQVVAPFTPSFNAQLQNKTSVVPADKMVCGICMSAWDVHGTWWSMEQHASGRAGN
jgi:hypothetical protein